MDTAPTNGNSKAIEKRKDPADAFIQILERAKKELQRAATKHLDVDRMSRLAITVLRKNPQLVQCTPVSFLASVMQATQLGLELDGVLGRAYLVPYKNNKSGQYEAQLVVGYRGMIELALRSGVVETVEANVVYEGDEWDYAEGLNRRLYHVPKFETDEPVKLTHAYAIVRFKGGGVLFKALPRVYCERTKGKSPGSKRSDSPWQNHYAVMCMKTVIRWLFKFMPASTELSRAVALDERHEAGVTQMVDAEVMDIDPIELQGEYRAADEPIVEDVPPGKVVEQAPAAGPPKTTAELKAREKAARGPKVLVHKAGCASEKDGPCSCGAKPEPIAGAREPGSDDDDVPIS